MAPRARPVIVPPSQMKKGPEAVLLLGPPTGCSGLRLRPTLRRRPPSFYPASASHNRLPRHSVVCVSSSRRCANTHTLVGQAS